MLLVIGMGVPHDCQWGGLAVGDRLRDSCGGGNKGQVMRQSGCHSSLAVLRSGRNETVVAVNAACLQRKHRI